MRLRDVFPLAIRALLINKGRSVLTMLGIIIGIASVMLMIGVGESAQRYLLSQVASFGSDIVFIANGKGDETRGGPPSANMKQTLTQKDYQSLRNLSWPKAVSGAVVTNDVVSYGGAERRTQIGGTSPDEIVVFSMHVATGRFVDSNDLESRARVVVLGQAVKDKLFGQEQPIGRMVKIAKQSYRVIGVLAPSGTRFFSNIDDQVYIPFTTFLEAYNKNRLNFISVKTGNVRPNEAKELIRITLRENHNIENPNNVLSKDDFQVGSQEDAIRNAAVIGNVLQILLGSIASISLVVAGVGIMNIMYVTVTKRTREIGLRKAVGATRSVILAQFLAEALTMTTLAGVIGVTLGISINWLAIFIIAQFQGGWSFSIPWNGALIGCAVSIGIGVLFGYFPARKAAHLNPIEALRHE